MENNQEKLYFHKDLTYDELLEYVETGDVAFIYKGRAYIITCHLGYCITVLDEGVEAWRSNLKYYDTYDELLKKHVFEDGVPLLEALKSEDIQDYV